jgi:hypothetical protein
MSVEQARSSVPRWTTLTGGELPDPASRWRQVAAAHLIGDCTAPHARVCLLSDMSALAVPRSGPCDLDVHGNLRPDVLPMEEPLVIPCEAAAHVVGQVHVLV